MNSTATHATDRHLAYLLVGHGTRNRAGQQQFEAVFQQFEQLMAPLRTGFAYLELAEPTIPEAVQRLAQMGTQRIITVPVLLFAAGHALQDIPDAVARAARIRGISAVGQSAPLELSQAVLELSALRFRQAVCHVGCPASCFQSCQAIHCPQTALAMIGRGSSSTLATEMMRQFSQRRRQFTPVAELMTGFVVAQTPSVEQVLEQLAQSRCRTVVVQPHLLFEGELIEQLRRQVADIQAANPHQRWVITQSLGTDFALAETLVALAHEVEGVNSAD